MSLDGLRGTPRAFDPRIHQIRPHPGQLASAAESRSAAARQRDPRVAHHLPPRAGCLFAALRPQVHGAVRDTLAEARRVFEIELNAVTDNPLVIGDEIVSGGNFHGQPLAFAAGLSGHCADRARRNFRTAHRRLVNPALNEELPAVSCRPRRARIRIHDAQVTAAALVAENRVLGIPASTGSITTSGNKEDFVSMGMASAAKLKQVVRNARHVLAIELLTAARALDCLRPLASSPAIERVRGALALEQRAVDRRPVLTADIEKVAEWIASGVPLRC